MGLALAPDAPLEWPVPAADREAARETEEALDAPRSGPDATVDSPERFAECLGSKRILVQLSDGAWAVVPREAGIVTIRKSVPVRVELERWVRVLARRHAAKRRGGTWVAEVAAWLDAKRSPEVRYVVSPRRAYVFVEGEPSPGRLRG